MQDIMVFADHPLSTDETWFDAKSLHPWPATVIGNPERGYKLVGDGRGAMLPLEAVSLQDAIAEAITLGVATPGGLNALLAPRGVAPRQRQGVVYFIGGDAGPVKIGFAENAERRLIGLQTGNPAKLGILATTAGSEATEREYHARFAAHRLNGEWFDRHPDILAEIERLSAHSVHGRFA